VGSFTQTLEFIVVKDTSKEQDVSANQAITIQEGVGMIAHQPIVFEKP